MPNPPLVSFVIPAYKKPPEVFEKCLASLFDMSLKDIEVIVVFDGADRDLEAVASRFPNVQSFVIEHGGAGRARNFGTSKARGRYVACWDADCIAKPEMAKRWMEEFEAVPDADFVYSGYEIAGERGGFESEPFDAYSLTCGNYISSMAPIRREKAPRWDESLKAGQDWDFWLTAVENGCKGAFIEGSGFITNPFGGESISAGAWSRANREETIRTVREKHGITGRDIGVFSLNYAPRALKIAEILGGDLIKPTGCDITAYRTIINIGYGHLSRFEGIGPDVAKIQYWVPGEIEGLAEAKYSVVMETIRIAKGVTNLCNTQYEQNRLSNLGITADVLPLALKADDLEKTRTTLPAEFSVLVLCDEAYGKLLHDIQLDLPHIKFGFHSGKIQDYSCVLSFYRFATVDEAVLVALVNGRTVISNIEAPFCGYVDPGQNWEVVKKELYEKIREARGKPLNTQAQAYYRQLASPTAFKERILSYRRAPQLEVV